KHPQASRRRLAMDRPAWKKLRMSMRGETVSYDDPVATLLMKEMEVDLARYYGERHYPPQNLVEWSAPHGTMVVALYEAQPVGCGGFIRLDETTAELKRMFVRMAYRRRGVASAVLAALE